MKVRTAVPTTCAMACASGSSRKLNSTGLNSVDWQASRNWAAASSQSSTAIDASLVLGPQIVRELGDADSRPGFVENPADLRHPVGDRHHNAERRGFIPLAQEVEIGRAKPGENGVDVTIGRIEVERILGVHLAFLVNDGREQLLLIGEIDVERALRHPCRTGDVVHAGGIEAMLQEDGARPLDNLPPLGVIFGWWRLLAARAVIGASAKARAFLFIRSKS